MEIEVEGQVIQLSEAGWLENLDEWTPAIAEKIAADVEGIDELTQEHWDIINLSREAFYEDNRVSEPRKFMKLMKQKFGRERGTNKYIFKFFPKGGLIKSANKIGGLPRPKGCS